LSESANTRRLRLHAQATAPRQARDFLAEACASWHAEQFIEPGRLALSELVSNAVVHAGTELDVDLRLADGALTMSVHDTGPGVPRAAVPDPRAIGGRGLDIVARTAESWGVALDAVGGKSVWCVLRVNES
jgi:anti-sigma regulatory factor (Ser/Thr protein kinase)